MKSIIRQVFGTTRPRDIWMDLLTFDRLVSKPIVHIVYWCGLGLLIIAACATLGVAVGSGLKDGTVMGWVLSLPLLIIGWLSILITILLWRACCEFFMAVMSIAEDLRVLRQYQEKLDAPAAGSGPSVIKPVTPPQANAEFDVPTPDTIEDVRPAAEKQPGERDILEDPFFRPRFERRDI